MAVEAQHHHLFSPQLYRNRENTKAVENPACIYNPQMGVAGAGVSLASVAMVPASTTNESGGIGASKKRPRESLPSLSFLGENFSSQVYSHIVDVDRLIVQHVMNMRTELSQRRKRMASQIIEAMNESVSMQLKSKDEEIEQLRKLNCTLEERIKSLDIENNAWRYLASTHQAAAAALRANLDQVLAEQAVVAAADEAESCCGDNFCYDEQLMDRRRMCTNCNGGEPSVLLLPCRHLCLCLACAPTVGACPICKCRKDGSVNVNLS